MSRWRTCAILYAAILVSYSPLRAAYATKTINGTRKMILVEENSSDSKLMLMLHAQIPSAHISQMRCQASVSICGIAISTYTRCTQYRNAQWSIFPKHILYNNFYVIPHIYLFIYLWFCVACFHSIIRLLLLQCAGEAACRSHWNTINACTSSACMYFDFGLIIFFSHRDSNVICGSVRLAWPAVYQSTNGSSSTDESPIRWTWFNFNFSWSDWITGWSERRYSRWIRQDWLGSAFIRIPSK